MPEPEPLPPPSVPVPEISRRVLVNRVVRAYCHIEGMHYNAAYNKLYGEFLDRYHVDLRARAEGDESPLAVAERVGLLEELYALACHLFVPRETAP